MAFDLSERTYILMERQERKMEQDMARKRTRVNSEKKKILAGLIFTKTVFFFIYLEE